MLLGRMEKDLGKFWDLGGGRGKRGKRIKKEKEKRKKEKKKKMEKRKKGKREIKLSYFGKKIYRYRLI